MQTTSRGAQQSSSRRARSADGKDKVKGKKSRSDYYCDCESVVEKKKPQSDAQFRGKSSCLISNNKQWAQVGRHVPAILTLTNANHVIVSQEQRR